VTVDAMAVWSERRREQALTSATESGATAGEAGSDSKARSAHESWLEW
jgi:hypothetical protein